MKIDGGCHRGYIKYEGEADPEKTTICHCTDCQHLSGSAFRTVVRVAGDTFKIIAGEPTIYVKTAESGARRVQGFCPDVERQSTRPLKETPRNCTPSVRELHVNVLRLSQGADSVSLAIALGHRPGLRSQPGQAVSCGA
jgi:hypothetical protein